MNHVLAVVIPAKDESDFLPRVLAGLPSSVDHVVVVDAGSSDGIAAAATTANVAVTVEVLHASGQGVGAAVAQGYAHLDAFLPDDALVAVMDGDDQMDPEDLLPMCTRLIETGLDAVKGNRRASKRHRASMPWRRRMANAGMSWLTSLAAGRPVPDAQCGFVVLHRRVLAITGSDPVWEGYGYVNHRFIRWSGHRLQVGFHPVQTRYGAERSGVRASRFFFGVGWMLVREHHRRAYRAMVRGDGGWRMPLAFVAYLAGWAALLHPPAWPMLPLGWMAAHMLDRSVHAGGRARI